MKVLSVRSDGAAIVSTRGLRRIVNERGRVLAEMITTKNAAIRVAAYNSCFPGGESKASAITYREVFMRQHPKSLAKLRRPRRSTAHQIVP